MPFEVIVLVVVEVFGWGEIGFSMPLGEWWAFGKGAFSRKLILFLSCGEGCCGVEVLYFHLRERPLRAARAMVEMFWRGFYFPPPWRIQTAFELEQ